MIEQLPRETRTADLRKLLRVRHRRVCALRDERVERSNPTLRKKVGRDRKKKVGVIVACFVGNDCEDALAGFDDVECFANDGGES